MRGLTEPGHLQSTVTSCKTDGTFQGGLCGSRTPEHACFCGNGAHSTGLLMPLSFLSVALAPKESAVWSPGFSEKMTSLFLRTPFLPTPTFCDFLRGVDYI